MRRTLPFLWCLAALTAGAVPATAQGVNDTNTKMSLGYEYRRLVKEKLRYARQESRDTIGADIQSTDQFIEFRLRSSFRIVDLVKGR